MTDEASAISDEQLESLNQFLNANVGEDGLRCPVSGQDVPFTEWNAPAAVLVLPGKNNGPGYEVLPLTSPMGGIVLISTVKLAGWQKDQDEKDKSGHGEAGEDRK